MKSLIAKRSVSLAGHKTSVSLEEPFWNCLRDIANARKESVSDLIVSVNADRQHGNLSSALRLFVLGFYRDLERTQDRSGDFSGSVGVPLKPSRGESVVGNGPGYVQYSNGRA
jgi:predicted DNA-binding ribbon-helix-helix protein